MKLISLVTFGSLIVTGVNAETYSPASFDLMDGIEVVPQFKSSVLYDDNIYTSEDDPTSSFVFINQPSISFGISNGINRYGGSYSLTLGNYSEVDDGDDDYIDHSFSLTSHTEFTDKNRFDFNLNFNHLHDDRGSNSTDSASYTYDEPLIYNNYKGKAYYEFGGQSALMNIGGGVQYTKKVYQNFTDSTQYDDTETIKFLLDGAYRIGSITSITLGISHADVTYLNKEDSVASQNNNDNNVYLGMRWSGLGKITGSVKLGYQYKTFDDSSREDFKGNTVDINMSWLPVTYSKFTLGVTREAEGSSSYGDYVLAFGSDLTWTHTWSDTIKTVSMIEYTTDEYVGSSTEREDKTLSASFNVNYSFSRWLLLSTGFGYSNRDSSLYGYGYKQNTVNLGIKISL
jgi:hypothetical protein